MKINFRQGLISAEIGQQFQPSYLVSNGSGVTIRTVNRPVIFTVASGPKDYTVGYYKDVLAWPTLMLNGVTQGWLYIDLNRATSARTYGVTTIAPISSSTAPLAPANGQHWFDRSAVTMKVYNFTTAVWTPVIRIFAGKYSSGTVESYPIGTQVGLSPVTSASGTIVVDSFGVAIKDSHGHFVTTEDVLTIDGAATLSAKLDSNVVTAEAGGNIPAFYIVKYDQNGKLVLANYEDVGLATVGVATVDAVASEPVSLVLSGKVFNANWNWSAPNQNLWVGTAGQLVTVDPYINPGKPTRHAPVARTLDAQSIIFDPGFGLAGEKGAQGEPGAPGVPQLPTDLPVYSGALAGTELLGTVKNDQSVAISANQIVTVATSTLQPAIDAKAPLASPVFTGAPTAPTQLLTDNSKRLVNTELLTQATVAIVDAAPTPLNTLKKLATSVNNDPTFAATVNTALALKANSSALSISTGSGLVGYSPANTYVAGTVGERLKTVDSMETQFNQIQTSVDAITADPTNSVTSWTVQAKSFDVVQGTATYSAITNRLGAWNMPNSTASYISMVISLPAHWAKMDVYLQWVNIAANAGNVVLGGEIHKWAIGESINVTPSGGSGIIPANPTPWIVTETKVAADLVLDSSRNTTLRIARQGASANDTLANGIAVIAVRLVKKV